MFIQSLITTILMLLLNITSFEAIETSNSYADCSDAYSESQYSFDYSKKAYNAVIMDSMTYYASKAMTAFDDASTYAEDCNCGDASISADDGYTEAKKAYNAKSLEDGHIYAKKAMSSADDAMLYLEDCEEN